MNYKVLEEAPTLPNSEDDIKKLFFILTRVLSREKQAQLLGVSPKTISRYEKGETKLSSRIIKRMDESNRKLMRKIYEKDEEEKRKAREKEQRQNPHVVLERGEEIEIPTWYEVIREEAKAENWDLVYKYWKMFYEDSSLYGSLHERTRPYFLNHGGLGCHMTGRVDESIKYFELARKFCQSSQQPLFSSILSNLGSAYAHNCEFDRAYKCCEEAHVSNPRLTAAIYNGLTIAAIERNREKFQLWSDRLVQLAKNLTVSEMEDILTRLRNDPDLGGMRSRGLYKELIRRITTALKEKEVA